MHAVSIGTPANIHACAKENNDSDVLHMSACDTKMQNVNTPHSVLREENDATLQRQKETSTYTVTWDFSLEDD